MKNLKRRILAALLASAALALTLFAPMAGVEAQAAETTGKVLTPKTSPESYYGEKHMSAEQIIASPDPYYGYFGVLPDGTLFDAIYYGNNNPDIAAVYGSVETDLNQYLLDTLGENYEEIVESEAKAEQADWQDILDEFEGIEWDDGTAASSNSTASSHETTISPYAKYVKWQARLSEANDIAAEKLAEHYWNTGRFEGRDPVDENMAYVDIYDLTMPCFYTGLTPTQAAFMQAQSQDAFNHMLTEGPDEMVRLVNEFRTANGLNALVKDDSLMAFAQTRAEEQWPYDKAISKTEDGRIWAHIRPNGQPLGCGENCTYSGDAALAFRGLYFEPGHRANMLGSYTRIGVGACLHDDGNIYWVQDFK